MEKKNTILLTVIAIATLLVAVVGATFAYFTATVTTDKADGNNTTNVKTYALASAKMEMGSKVTADGVYPGYKAVKSVAIKGECPAGNTSCEDINTVITITPTIPTEFGTDVTWKLYKSSTEITCSSNPVTDGGQYYDSGSCTGATEDKVVLDGDKTAKTLNVVVSSTTNDTYYLVVDYANNASAAQNAAQGKSFSVAIDFASAQ